MQSIREQFDADRNYARGNYTKFPTALNHFNLYCSNCHESFYVDKDFFEQTMLAIEEGLDNPFVCDECQEEYAELEHQGH